MANQNIIFIGLSAITLLLLVVLPILQVSSFVIDRVWLLRWQYE